MPTIHRIGNILIQVYARDHNPPHFHIVTPGGQAMIGIDALEVIRGSVSRRELDIALEWASANKDALADAWNRLNAR